MMNNENFELNIDSLEAAAGGRVLTLEEVLRRRPSVDTYAPDYVPPCPEEFWPRS